MKVALIHDWLVSKGGGERFLKSLHEIWPGAPIYTLVYDEGNAPDWCQGCDIRTTYIQKWPGGRTHHRYLLSFMPKAWESLDLAEYDLVISSCASCCKGVITRPDAVHICYCHSPIRYVWDMYHEYLRNASFLKRVAMPSMIHKVRMWDYQAAQRVDQFISNSDFVGARIKKYYRRDSRTIYSGVPIIDEAVPERREDYYLIVSRFVSYKRVDLAIEACNRLGVRLLVAGSGGEEEKRLQSLAGPTVEFLGAVSDFELRDLYRRAKAFLFPGIEDFGLTPVEAMEGGCPVIAYAAGGALETVSAGATGIFFNEQTPESLMDAIISFENNGVSCGPDAIHSYVKNRFSSERFKEEFSNYCKRAVEECALREMKTV